MYYCKRIVFFWEGVRPCPHQTVFGYFAPGKLKPRPEPTEEILPLQNKSSASAKLRTGVSGQGAGVPATTGSGLRTRSVSDRLANPGKGQKVSFDFLSASAAATSEIL